MMKSKFTHDIDAIYHQAKRSFFEAFEDLAEGALATDEASRIVWINKKYLEFLGMDPSTDVIGEPVDKIVPGSLIPKVIKTGEPIVLDVMEFERGWTVVSRFPLKNATGEIIGAFGFVLFSKLDRLAPLISRIQTLEEKLEQAIDKTRRTKYSLSQFIGSSPQVLKIKDQARIASNKSSAVLISGATGTGKELLAQAIHSSSSRSSNNFVAINVAAVPENLLEVEFFGAVAGAYTGASSKGRIGKLQLADKGTLFLDELGDMPISIQVKLLRVLQEQEFEPIGSNKVIKVDLRVIAATSQPLDRLIKEGSFRKDLFYRLNVISIDIPPLCKHKSDLRLLCDSLLDDIARESNEPLRSISDEAVAFLSRYDWPGNIRELRNMLDRACAMSSNEIFTPDVFKDFFPNELPEQDPAPVTSDYHVQDRDTLPMVIAHIEEVMIKKALASTSGNRAQAAKQLGISRSLLYTKLKQHGIT